jgi:hypothetical protein
MYGSIPGKLYQQLIFGIKRYVLQSGAVIGGVQLTI